MVMVEVVEKTAVMVVEEVVMGVVEVVVEEDTVEVVIVSVTLVMPVSCTRAVLLPAYIICCSG